METRRPFFIKKISLYSFNWYPFSVNDDIKEINKLQPLFLTLQVAISRWNHEFDHLHCYRYCNQHVKIQLFLHQNKKKCGENSELSIHLKLFRFVTVYGFQQEYALLRVVYWLTNHKKHRESSGPTKILSNYAVTESWLVFVLLRTRWQNGKNYFKPVTSCETKITFHLYITFTLHLFFDVTNV